MEDLGIAGLEFTVNSKDREGGIQLIEDEWYPCILTEITPFENQWGKQLRWVYELQGEQFTWRSKDGKSGQFKVNGQTSFACSPKSKLYKTYAKLMGKEPTEGEKISLKNVIGMHVQVMIKINHGKDKQGEPKDYFNIDKVKPSVGPGVVIPTPAPVVAPVGSITPATVVAPVVAPVATPTVAPVVKTGDIFEDIF